MQSIARVNKTNTRERIVALLREVADAQEVVLPSETESLFDAGVLDSFGLLEFITTIEEEFSVVIPEDDLVPSNFDTLAKICAYIAERVEH